MPRILLATHGAPSADGAARIAALLARRLGAELDVVAVLEPVQPIDYGFGVTPASTPEEDEAVEREVTAEARSQLAAAGIDRYMPLRRTGVAATEIAAVARETGAALIVVGLGPHAAIDRALGGETALQLVQQASSPVLAVPGDAARLPRRIVAAIDFTATSVRAALTAAHLLAPGDALHLVHGRTRTDERAEARAAGQLDEEGDALPSEQRLIDFAANLPLPGGATSHTALLDGHPAPALLDYVARVHGDAIALGTHGYGLWKRLTIGSVSSKVLRVAGTAVLVQPLGSLATPVEPVRPELHII